MKKERTYSLSAAENPKSRGRFQSSPAPPPCLPGGHFSVQSLGWAPLSGVFFSARCCSRPLSFKLGLVLAAARRPQDWRFLPLCPSARPDVLLPSPVPSSVCFFLLFMPLPLFSIQHLSTDSAAGLLPLISPLLALILSRASLLIRPFPAQGRPLLDVPQLVPYQQKGWLQQGNVKNRGEVPTSCWFFLYSSVFKGAEQPIAYSIKLMPPSLLRKVKWEDISPPPFDLPHSFVVVCIDMPTAPCSFAWFCHCYFLVCCRSFTLLSCCSFACGCFILFGLSYCCVILLQHLNAPFMSCYCLIGSLLCCVSFAVCILVDWFLFGCLALFVVQLGTFSSCGVCCSFCLWMSHPHYYVLWLLIKLLFSLLKVAVTLTYNSPLFRG